MKNSVFEIAQDYLTIINENRVKRIVDLGDLIKRYPWKKILSVLQDISYEKERHLMELIEGDKTCSAINDTIATIFRIQMGIDIILEGLENRKEVSV